VQAERWCKKSACASSGLCVCVLVCLCVCVCVCVFVLVEQGGGGDKVRRFQTGNDERGYGVRLQKSS